MKNIWVSMTLLLFVLFSSACVVSQQGNVQTSTNNYPENTQSGQSKNVDKAANQEDGKAEYNLGEKYFNGEGVPQDYAKAVYWYTQAAKRGYIPAQNYLGLMYYYGKGIPQNYKKAVYWYTQAAEWGCAPAQFMLGSMYCNGQGIPQDYTEAVKWLRKAAKQGLVDAQYRLGLMYYISVGIPQDYTEAAKWYRKAAEQGDPNAQLCLGHMYYYGKGVPKDYAKAAEWYRKATEHGYDSAQFALGNMCYNGEGVPQDYRKAAEWYRKAAEQGYAFAQFNLGHMYYYGQGVPKDYVEAVEWYRKAAEQGDAGAQFNLGLMYKNGEGVTKDYAKAVKWYRKAAEQGFAFARTALGKLLENTDYPGWEYLGASDTGLFFINKNKIRQQANLVWYWTMNVPFQKSDSGKKCTKRCQVADCDNARSGFVSYIEYDSNGDVIDSYTFKESEINMSPVVPGSIGESTLEHACTHAKAGVHQKREAAKKGACFGTGWPVAAGFVVTNNHVVEGRNDITLIRPDGVKIPASVAAYDAFNDLALLKVEDTGLLPAALPLSSKPAVQGEKIVTVGYPHPDLLGVKPKLTEGVVNSTSGLGDDPRALQISVPIQAGNSGGPLVNMEGKVVGIVTSKVDAVKMFKWTNDLPQNINYGIKISYLRGLLSSVSQKQRIDTVAPFKYISVEELAKKIKNSVLMIVAK